MFDTTCNHGYRSWLVQANYCDPLCITSWDNYCIGGFFQCLYISRIYILFVKTATSNTLFISCDSITCIQFAKFLFVKIDFPGYL